MLNIITLSIILCSVFCSAINIESAEEGACFDPPPNTVTYDTVKFANASVVWYHQLWSKYYLYRVAADVTQRDYNDISDNYLQNACYKFSAENRPGFISVSGNDGQRRSFETGAGSIPDSFRWKGSGKIDWDGEARVTKAGSDYFVVVTCFTTNQRAFTVASSTPTLSPQLKNEIIEHVESLGFSRDYIYDPNTPTCFRNQNQQGGSNGYVYAVPSIPFHYPNILTSK